MSYLLDTSVISEIRKGERGDESVVSWYQETEEGSLYLGPTALVAALRDTVGLPG